MGLFDRLFAKSYATINVQAAQEILSDGGILVDVRTQAEWNAGHAPIARHIPLDAVARRATELPSGTPIVAICRSGARSATAASTLAAAGFTVSSVRGGMAAWQRAGGRVVNSKGKDGRI